MKMLQKTLSCAAFLLASFVHAQEASVVVDLEGPFTVHGQQVKGVWKDNLKTCGVFVDGKEKPLGVGLNEIPMNVEVGERTFIARCYGPAIVGSEGNLSDRQKLFESYDFVAKTKATAQTIYLDRINYVTLTLVMVKNPTVEMFVNSAEIVESSDYTLILRDKSKLQVALGERKQIQLNWHYDNPPIGMEKDGIYLGKLVYERYFFSLMPTIQVTLEATQPDVNMNLEFRQTTALFDENKGLLIDEFPTEVQTFKVDSVNPADYQVLIQNKDGSLLDISGTIYTQDTNFGFVSGDKLYLSDNITISIDWSQIDTQGKVFRIILKKFEEI